MDIKEIKQQIKDMNLKQAVNFVIDNVGDVVYEISESYGMNIDNISKHNLNVLLDDIDKEKF